MTKQSKSDEPVPRRSCPGAIEIPTEEEREALAAMKAIKDRVRVLKSQLTSLKTAECEACSPEERAMEAQLSHLRVEWDTWDERRQRAQKKRMILLGHEKAS
jgi:hypothetical protein